LDLSKTGILNVTHLSLSVTLHESSLTAEDHETEMRATPVCHTGITCITCVSLLSVTELWHTRLCLVSWPATPCRDK